MAVARPIPRDPPVTSALLGILPPNFGSLRYAVRDTLHLIVNCDSDSVEFRLLGFD